MKHKILWKKDQRTDKKYKLSCLLAGHKYSSIWKSSDNSEIFAVEDKSQVKWLVPKKGYFICARCQHKITKEEYLK